MKKFVIGIIGLLTIALFQATCYAEIHFDIERVEVGQSQPLYDLERKTVLYGEHNYVWPDTIPIPLISQMPQPNIVNIGGEYYDKVNGYLTTIDGTTYWMRKGARNSPLSVVPLENVVTEMADEVYSMLGTLNEPQYDTEMQIMFETGFFNERPQGVRDHPLFKPTLGKWTFYYDKEKERTVIFVDSTYYVYTDVWFQIRSNSGSSEYENVLYWEDETYFYIKNYNLLLKTPKQEFYDTLNALESAPKVKVNGTLLGFEQPPVVEQDRTLARLRDIRLF